MLQSHFKLAYRHLLKNKSFSLINISGLAVSIAAAFLSFFLIPALVIVAMVAITTFFQTWRATNTNPVNHLRNE